MMLKLRGRQLVGGAFLLALGVLAGFQPSRARADLLITVFNVTKSGSDYTYTYNVFLNPGYQLVPPSTATSHGQSTPNLFTVYDIPGFVSAAIVTSPPAPAPALSTTGFSPPSTQLIGITPKNTSPPDSPTIENITFEYTSSMPTTNPAPGGAGGTNLYLGQFSITSTLGPATTANLYYTGATQKDIPGSPSNLELANNVSLLVGPSFTVIPEPPSLLLFGIGIPALGGLWYLRSRRLLRLA
jgi:hypothetical protein